MAGDPGLFRDLCESAHDLIQSVTLDGRLLYVNQAWLDTLGYREEDLDRIRLFDVIHQDHHEHCRRVLEQLEQGQAVAPIELEFVARDGRRVPVEGSVSCRFENGRPVATCGIFRDLTARRHAEAELDRLFELSLDLLCVAGTDGYFKHINPAFERVLGYSNGELLSRSFIEFVHPDDRDSTLERVEELAKGLPVVDFKNRYRAKNGAYRWLSWRSASLPEQGLIYAVARDITDEKRVQERLARQAEELARSNADLERFAYVASHDLRAPLRSIAQLAEWIREESATALPDEAREHLTLLDEQVRRLDGLIEDLLRFARAGHERVAGEQVDTATMIGELTSLLALPRGFLVEIEGEMPVLHTARAPLEQVFRNLLSNAIEHHDRSTGTVRVSAISSGERVEFVVADDGPGIPEQQRERIFKMFETLPSSAEHPGSGIGLALVRRLVEAFGGRVWVESTGERGATFRFTWPQRIEDPDA